MAEPLFTRVDRPAGKLVSDVIEGRIGLPDLQRPFVWKDSDVRDLLDSMLRGYPIGYCILWEAPDNQEDKKSPIGLNQKSFAAPKELVIDGRASPRSSRPSTGRPSRTSHSRTKPSASPTTPSRGSSTPGTRPSPRMPPTSPM